MNFQLLLLGSILLTGEALQWGLASHHSMGASAGRHLHECQYMSDEEEVDMGEVASAFNLEGPEVYSECQEAFFKEQRTDEEQHLNRGLVHVSSQRSGISQWGRPLQLSEEEEELCKTLPFARRAFFHEDKKPQRRISDHRVVI